MIVRPKGSVIVPRHPSSIAGLIGWAREANKAIQQLRDRVFDVPGGVGGGGGAVSTPCPFGEIITWVESSVTITGIRGGLITCGDQNFNVEPYALDLETPGVWLVSVKISGIEPATDDDDTLFLPGVTTASGTPTWHLKVWTDPTDYDPNDNPSFPGDTCQIVLPCGKLTITDGGESPGVASIEPVACGNFDVTQCVGILSSSRT